MMPKIDSEKFYTSAIEMHGTTARGVNWASKENQELRFKEIMAFLPQDMKSFTLGDAGCGFGDFYRYLTKRKRHLQRYVGIDSVIDMYSIASNATAQEILHLDICKESLPNMDYYICSGALNVLTKFETQLFIQNCYNSSKVAFIFNVLEGDKESDTYNYMSKDEILEIAKRVQVKETLFRENYMENDITVMFVR
jgi:SAM-dependent methyltransferase